MLVRGAVAAICLLPPTVLMGASLPAIARWTEAKKIEGLPLYRQQHNARSVDGLPSLDPGEST